MKIKSKAYFIFIISFCLLLLIIIGAISFGSTNIPFAQIINYILGRDIDPTLAIIIGQIRLPRVILSLLVGASLAIAGVLFQGIIQNPMVDPYIIGISAGAGTGVMLSYILGLQINFLFFNTVPLFAFAGAIITVFAVYRLAKVGNKLPVMTFLLAGVALSFILNSVMSFLMIIKSDNLQQIIYWLMGSLAGSSWQDIYMILPYFLFSLLVIIFYLHDLNIILLGEENAKYLGVEVEKTKKILLTFASLITAGAVSVSGSIGFIGLVIPHIARLLVGPDHRKLLPLATIFGGIFLLISDTMARTLLSPLEIPVGIITALAGGPYFIFLLRKNSEDIW